MKLTTVVTREHQLALTESELVWLGNQMQNPLHGESPESESKKDGDMRKAFFTACCQSYSNKR